ncbi:MAG TPA: FAD-binding oxidoreductase [Chloroflexota bacterium]
MNRKVLVATGLAGAPAVIPLIKKARTLYNNAPNAPAAWRRSINSHDKFTHDSINSLGYDWSRIADPGMSPVFPLRVYLPQSTEDVVHIVNECKQRGERLVVRSKGHSSNDLVLTRGSVLLVERLTKVLDFNELEQTVTVEPGITLSELDDFLALRGYGLPVIGTHNHITAGGFASVGGISAASHRVGLFVDNIVELEYVNWDGNVITCSRAKRPEDFNRVRMGLGEYGVITKVKERVYPVNKYHTILVRERHSFRDLEKWLAAARTIFEHGDEGALYTRVLWSDFPLRGGKNLTVGSISLYKETPQSILKNLRNTIQYGYLHRIGFVAGRVAPGLEALFRLWGIIGVLFSSKYASIKNIEIFIDKIIDYSVGDANRLLIIFSPFEVYEQVFRENYDLMQEYRKRNLVFTFLSCELGPFVSEYLGHGDPKKKFVDIVFEVGVNPDRMTDQLLEEVIRKMDDITIKYGAYRYMQTKTSRDPERRAAVNPNTYYAQQAGGVPVREEKG